MAERVTADRQLDRILQVLPVAARPEGVALSELAARLHLEPRQVLRDLEEVTARAFYHPAGSGDDIQVSIEEDRVRVWTKGEFRRPLRLNLREGLALGLGLRALAAEAGEERRTELLDLARRLETELASASPEALLARIALDAGESSAEGLRRFFREAARQGLRCRIRYLKPGAREPDERTLCPYLLVFASGAWYLLAHCDRSAGVRAFRLDRVLAAAPTGDSFAVPTDFDPEPYLAGGRVYRAEEDVEVVVRYSPFIARWLRELGPVEERADGSVVLRHRVADPRWPVRHVLELAPHAELLSPPDLREAVAATAGRFLT